MPRQHIVEFLSIKALGHQIVQHSAASLEEIRDNQVGHLPPPLYQIVSFLSGFAYMLSAPSLAIRYSDI